MRFPPCKSSFALRFLALGALSLTRSIFYKGHRETETKASKRCYKLHCKCCYFDQLCPSLRILRVFLLAAFHSFAASAIHSPPLSAAFLFLSVRPFVVRLCPINVENRCHFVHHPSSFPPLSHLFQMKIQRPHFQAADAMLARANITLERPFPLSHPTQGPATTDVR